MYARRAAFAFDYRLPCFFPLLTMHATCTPYLVWKQHTRLRDLVAQERETVVKVDATVCAAYICMYGAVPSYTPVCFTSGHGEVSHRSWECTWGVTSVHAAWVVVCTSFEVHSLSVPVFATTDMLTQASFDGALGHMLASPYILHLTCHT